VYHRLLLSLLSALFFLVLAHRARGGSQPVDLDTFLCQIGTGLLGPPTVSDNRIEDWLDDTFGGSNDAPESTLLPTREFEPNFGQTAREFPWLSRGEGFFLFLRPNGAVLDLRSPAGRPTAVIAVDFVDANPAAAFDPANFRSLQHYLTGPNPESWVTNVPVFDAVTFRDVYPGIDLAYYQRAGLLEHDWIVRPGADARRIRLRFSPGTSLRLNPAGDLLLSSGPATVRWAAPYSYARSTGRPVPSRWRLESGNEVSIEAAPVPAHETLVIDPPIEYLSYAGRTGYDVSGRAVTDAQGNLYLTGLTSNAEWPATPGAPLKPASALPSIPRTTSSSPAPHRVRISPPPPTPSSAPRPPSAPPIPTWPTASSSS